MLPTDLPVSEALPALRTALAERPNAVLVAPPGAGKTTLVPLALMAEPWAEGRILVLEPRRVAARAAARRMAQLLGEGAPGQRIALATRLDRAGGPDSRVEVVTEGLLVRRLQADPALEGVAAVLFDEAHERHLDTDLALALCLDLQRALRPDLRLLAMSATLEAARFATLLDGPVVESAGRAHPVAIRHRARDLADPRDLPEAMAAAVRAALAEHPGDLLCFLPGWSEIRRTAERLGGLEADVLPLHGELPPAEQDRALNPGPRRKVVLATSIAETSLTVPGVRVVIDGGFRRSPRLDPASGLSRLVTVRISRAAAEQRAGRAGREAPGVAIRLWSEALHRSLAPSDKPEILDSELSGLLLDCAAWGAAPRELPFLDAPPEGALAAAAALLRELDALDAGGRITETGRRMARLGAHPRLARVLVAAETDAERALAADLAALLEERDPLRGREAPADIALRLDLLHGADLAAADRAAVSRIRRTAALHRRRLRVHGDIAPAGDPAALLTAGFPDRIAAKRGTMDGAFRLASGQGARLSASDPLAKAPLLAVADLDLAGTEARIRMAAPITLPALEARFPARFRTEERTAFDERLGAVAARRRRLFGPLVLEETNLPTPDPAEAARALAAAIGARGFRDLAARGALLELAARIGWMRRAEGEAWPDASEAALAASAPDWLGPALYGMTRLAEARAIDAAGALRASLPAGFAQRLDRELPPRIALPGGRHAAVDYARDPPTLEARAQHLFGLGALPPLAAGRVPLQVALLSPAGRPVAVTGDLAGFWRGAWSEVRRDMRGRYPKHAWPERPWEGSSD